MIKKNTLIVVLLLLFINIVNAQNVSILNVNHPDTVEYGSSYSLDYFLVNTDYNCEALEIETYANSQYFFTAETNVNQLVGLTSPLSFYWFAFSQFVEFSNAGDASPGVINDNTNDTIDICVFVEDDIGNNCYLCDSLAWNGSQWTETNSNLTIYNFESPIDITMGIVPVGDPLDNLIEIPLETYSNQEDGFLPGDSIFYSTVIDISVQNFQQAGDNLVVIWPSTVSPHTPDTSFTQIYVLEDKNTGIIDVPNYSKEGKVYDLFGREYPSLDKVPYNNVFIHNRKKYLILPQ